MFSSPAMADEDEIKELIWLMGAAQRQGFHVPPGAMRTLLSALRFYLAARTWLAKPQADPRDDQSRKRRERYAGPAATLADLRRHGLVALIVTCDGPNCWNAKRITLDALRLPETTPVPETSRLRRFRCSRCGNRKVRVSRIGRTTSPLVKADGTRQTNRPNRREFCPGRGWSDTRTAGSPSFMGAVDTRRTVSVPRRSRSRSRASSSLTGWFAG